VAFSLFGKGPDLNKLAARAEAAATEGRASEAERLLREIIELELSEEQKEAGRRVIARAFLELGEICEARNVRADAFQHYRKARELGAPLSPAAWTVLAEGYAAKQSKTDHAVGAYLAYIHDHAPNAANAKIYSALEAVCELDETKKSAERKQAVELNRRVAAANVNLEWPYYYIAVAHLLDGDLPAALTHFAQARKLNPNRAMTYYWMGACHLQQYGGSREAADALSKFLTFPADSPQIAKRQAKAASELSKVRELLAQIPEPALTEPRLVARPSGSGPATGVLHCRSCRYAEAVQILEPLYRSGSDTDTVLFYLGMALVSLRRYRETLDLWNKLLARHPGHEKLQANIARVRYLLGTQLAAEGNYEASAIEWEQYLQQFPSDKETSKSLAELYLRQAPRQHLRRWRFDAAEAWERELKAHPGNRAALHNLAILYYRWAMGEESAGGPDVDRLWAAAIAYWTLIVHSDQFWSAWKSELEQRWGLEMRDADLVRLRDTFLDERFTRVFQNYSSSYKENNRPADAQRHEDYLTMALLEKKSAEAWRATGARFPMGGFLYCRQTGVLQEILEEIDRLPDIQQQKKLSIYFSPAELGDVLILLEETRLPEKALERLARLPEKVRQAPDATYLRVRALFESARASGDLRKVETAFAEALSLQPVWAPLRADIAELFDSLAKQEATRLRQDNRIAEAIRLLERLYTLSGHAEIREYLCILCCDGGFQKLNEKEFENGRAYFLKALGIDANYQRARQAMCIAFNNEALTLPDQDARLKMLQKALEYNPDDQHVRENLGTGFHEKALKIARAADQQNAALELGRAIGLLRTAALTLNPGVSEKWLTEFIASGGQRFQEEVRKMPADLYRTVLESLSQVSRKRIQSRS
jgi:tetratricopeptide (TPR) repeat protein